MGRWWLSEACFYALAVLAVFGVYALLAAVSAWPATAMGVVAIGVVGGIYWLGERAARGLL